MHKKLFLIALFSFILNGCLTGGSYIKDGSVEYYKKSAENGDAEAQYELGVIYDQGMLVTQDYNEAIKWLFWSNETRHFEIG